jgi:hypothetical protein
MGICNKLHPHPPQKGLRDQGLGKLPPIGRQNFGPSIPPPKKRKEGGFISGVAKKLYAPQFRYPKHKQFFKYCDIFTNEHSFEAEGG